MYVCMYTSMYITFIRPGTHMLFVCVCVCVCVFEYVSVLNMSVQYVQFYLLFCADSRFSASLLDFARMIIHANTHNTLSQGENRFTSVEQIVSLCVRMYVNLHVACTVSHIRTYGCLSVHMY